jgi:hypothetical protein
MLSVLVRGVLEAVDWQRFRYIEGSNNRGRPPLHSKKALLRAFIYKEFAGILSVSMLVKNAGRRFILKMKNFGFDHLPSESTFSRFKESVDVDRIWSS